MFIVEDAPKYCYHYTGDRFERPVRTAYKISVHESKRVNGVVTKKQFAVATIGYYSLADNYFALDDYDKKILAVAGKLNADANILYDIIDAKIIPLRERIQAEFQQSDEYKTRAEHERIISLYKKARADFAAKYECSERDYDYCFNVFGELMNRSYHEMIISNHENKRSSYQENYHSNYGKSDKNYFDLSGAGTSYSDGEKITLKNFYKTLSKAYHPDITKSDGKEMQLLNKLKESWGI